MIKRFRKLLIILFILLLIISWGLYSTYSMEVTHYTASSSNLPDEFKGFRIAHISDLHNTEYGEKNADLLSAIEAEKPDIIVVTGDLLDSYDVDVAVAAHFMQEAAKIAPCYYVCGNHELRMPMKYASLKKQMKTCGVTVLEDKSATIAYNGAKIQVIGLMDYSRLDLNYLKSLFTKEGYTLLLTHRPEHFSVYKEFGADLVLAGHTHGGQIQVPFVGAVYAPGQGVMPDYAEGKFAEGSCSMIVSRGLGNSSIPFRFSCRPELAIITLTQK